MSTKNPADGQLTRSAVANLNNEKNMVYTTMVTNQYSVFARTAHGEKVPANKDLTKTVEVKSDQKAGVAYNAIRNSVRSDSLWTDHDLTLNRDRKVLLSFNSLRAAVKTTLCVAQHRKLMEAVMRYGDVKKHFTDSKKITSTKYKLNSQAGIQKILMGVLATRCFPVNTHSIKYLLDTGVLSEDLHDHFSHDQEHRMTEEEQIAKGQY